MSGPTPTSRRDTLPDLLRGLAVGGILIVNMQDFAGFREWDQTGVDRVAQALTDFLVNGKSISLFALLFGAGLAAFTARHGVGRAAWRLAVLLALGGLHFALLWHGDIIANYALTGVALLALVRVPVPALLGLAALLEGGWLLWQLLSALGSTGARWTTFDAFPAGATYASILLERARTWWPDLWANTLFNFPLLLALLSLGAGLQRAGVLSRPEAHRGLLRGLLIAGAVLGTPLNVWLVWLNTQDSAATGYFALVARMAGGLAFALAYLGGFGLLVAAGRGRRLAPLVAAGRMSLTHYLTQSLVCTTLFYPYALAQFGRWGAAACLLFALALYAVQVAVSRPWLARFGRGPLEALLRLAVYGRRRA